MKLCEFAFGLHKLQPHQSFVGSYMRATKRWGVKCVYVGVALAVECARIGMPSEVRPCSIQYNAVLNIQLCMMFLLSN